MNVDVRLEQQADVDCLSGFDEVIIATGVIPRKIQLEGVEHHKVISYIDVITKQRSVGKSVAIIGAGGIGFDVAELLTQEGKSSSLDNSLFNKEWNIDTTIHSKGGVLPHKKSLWHQLVNCIYYSGKTVKWEQASVKQPVGYIVYH